MNCPFCNKENVEDRIFYEDIKWMAFLAAPPHTKGHIILAAQPLKKGCPEKMDKNILSGLNVALHNVTEAIQKCYNPPPKDILTTSLRGDIKHVHFHLVPLWAEDEQYWRRVTGYKKAHLMEFLGSLEKKHDFEVLDGIRNGIQEDEQRTKAIELMSEEIVTLRKFTGYKKKV